MNAHNCFEPQYTRAIAAYNRGDVDAYIEDFSPEYIHHWVNEPEAQTREQYKQGLESFLVNFPGAQITLDEVIAQGTIEAGTVVYRFRLTGTGTGEFRGIPVEGKKISFCGYSTLHMINGKVIEGWQLNDDITFFTQLGLTMAPAAPISA